MRFFTGPGSIATLFTFFFIIVAQISRISSDWWLGEWGRNSFNISQTKYIWIFALISIVVGFLFYIKGIFFAKFILSSSRVIQQKLISVLLKTPLSWFDITPTGRILARTIKDQDDLDNNLSFIFQNSIQNIIILVASIVLISIATPLYLIIAIISGFAYYKIVLMYMNSSR